MRAGAGESSDTDMAGRKNRVQSHELNDPTIFRSKTVVFVILILTPAPCTWRFGTYPLYLFYTLCGGAKRHIAISPPASPPRHRSFAVVGTLCSEPGGGMLFEER
jgi:hypothetical protein